jgi:hypothetical protein
MRRIVTGPRGLFIARFEMFTIFFFCKYFYIVQIDPKEQCSDPDDPLLIGLLDPDR